MNGLLRHTSNIHIGKTFSSSRYSYLGVVYDNIKAGYVFVSSGLRTAGSSVVGLIKNVRL